MSFEQFSPSRDFSDSRFDEFVPSSWAKGGLLTLSSDVKPKKAKTGIDIFSFFRNFAVNAATASSILAVVTSSTAYSMESKVAYSENPSAVELTAEDIYLTTSNSFNYVVKSQSLGNRDQLWSGFVGGDSILLNPDISSRLISKPQSFSFAPSEDQLKRLLPIASALERLGNVSVDLVDDEEFVAEAGLRGRSLTILLRPDTSRAMYRRGQSYDVNHLYNVALSASPSPAELDALVQQYLSDIIEPK